MNFMLLRTQQLTKDYGRFRALDRLDLEAAPGEIVGLLGPNGSGKSTALRLMLGFLRPTAGTAHIAGHDCWHDGTAARRHVAYLPGELRLYENMTGRRLVTFLAELRGQRLSERAEGLARCFDVDLDRPVAHLSSGMKRKLALVQVLLAETPLVLLDEPTSTLDPTMRATLLQQLVEARQRGQTVLFSSHVLSEVEQVCDRVAILQRGRLVHWQPMTTLQAARRVRARLGRSTEPPNLPGVRHAEARDGELTLEYEGPLPVLLSWLAAHDVKNLQVEPLGLAGIYRHYHPQTAEAGP